jgi:hypothetical protein
MGDAALAGTLPAQKEDVTVIGTVTPNDKGYDLVVEAVQRGGATIIGRPVPAK